MLQRFLGWGPAERGLAASFPALLAGAVVAAAAFATTRRESRGWTWLYGWRLPAGWRWWPAALVLALLAALGAWRPPLEDGGPGPLGLALLALALLALGLEMLFRGLAHGMLLNYAEIQQIDGKIFVSRPNLAAAAIFSVFGALVLWQIRALPVFGFGAIVDGLLAWLLLLAAGILAGILRERSLSLWPAAAAWALGSQARLCYELFL
jgi:hypothetical protein